MTDKLKKAADDLAREVDYLTNDPSPHAPEIPFTLRECIDRLLDVIRGCDLV